MPGFLLHFGATVTCMHAGQAQPTRSSPPVTVNGQPVVTQSAVYTVVGCTLPPPANGPCVTAQWVTAAVRVKVAGEPVLLQDSRAICVPTNTPLIVTVTQTRVKGM